MPIPQPRRVVCLLVILASATVGWGDKPRPLQPQETISEEMPGLKRLSASQQGMSGFLCQSAVNAAAFRREWLDTTQGPAIVTTLAKLMEQFQRAAVQPLVGRPSLDAFQLSPQQIVQRFRGELLPHKANQGVEWAPFDLGWAHYEAFRGTWFGRWSDFDVDHHWSRVVRLAPPLLCDGVMASASSGGVLTSSRPMGLAVHGYQYAWIGDGYGVNLIASQELVASQELASQVEGKQRLCFLLGYVEHLRDGDFDKITLRRPHVGLEAGAGRLIWITASEVFYEQILDLPHEPQAYCITGFDYRLEAQKLTSRRGFQAIYSRDADRRKTFYEFPLQLEARRVDEN